jgi:hypothetical protein
MIRSGWEITATWPIRTDAPVGRATSGPTRLLSRSSSPAGPGDDTAPATSRRAFLEVLKSELPSALKELQQGFVPPVEAAFTTLREQMVQRELTNIPTALADWWTPSEPADDRLGDTVVSADRYRGNAADDGRDNRGWILGHFIESSKDVRSTRDVEVKWGIHPAEEKEDSVVITVRWSSSSS